MAATTILAVAGDAQEQGIANTCAIPLTVVVTDGTGNGVAGVVVTFAISAIPSGSTMQALSTTTASTNTNGQASCALTLGEIAGAYQVTATAIGLTGSPVIFTETALAIQSLAQVKNYLGFSDTAHDSLIAPWIGLTTERIESALGQPVTPRNYTEILSGTGASVIYFKHGRLASLQIDNTGSVLSSVQYRGISQDTWQNIVATDAQVFADPADDWSLELLDGYYFPWGIGNIQVKKIEGFHRIPGDITNLVSEMVQIMYDESKAGRMPRLGMKTMNRSQSPGSMGDTFGDLTPRWEAVINRYKRTR